MAGPSNPIDAWLSSEPVPPSFYPQDHALHLSSAPAVGFQELIDRAQRAMAICDRELRYLAVNRQWKKDFGLEERNLVGQKHGDLFPYLGVHWDQAVESVLLGHPEECPRDKWILPSNRPAGVRWHLEPWSSKRGTIGGFTITCEIQDMELSDPLHQIGRSLLRSSTHPFVRVDLDGCILEWNAAARDWAVPPQISETPVFFWDAFCPEEQRDGFRLRFLHDARETLERQHFCFAPVWNQTFPPSHPAKTTAAWAAHPYLDAQEQIAGVLFLGSAIPQTSPLPLPSAAGASLAQLVDSAPLGLVLLDSEGQTVFANHEHAALLGLDLRSHATINDWLRSACPRPEDAPKLEQTWRTSVWQEEATRVFVLRSSDHHLRHIRFQPRRTGDGGLLLALSDVTEFHQKLEHLEDTEGHFRSLFHHAQVGLALEDASGKILIANAACAALTQQSPDQLREHSFLALVHPDDRPTIQARLAEIRQDPSSQAASLDVRLSPDSRTGTGATTDAFVRLTICGIPGPRGDLLHLAYFLTDVAIQPLKPGSPNQDQAASLAALRRQALAFEHEEEAILITDRAGRIVDWNPAATRLFGYSRQAVLGKSFAILFAPRQPQPFHLSVAAAFAETGGWTATQTFFREDGSKGICQVRYIAASAPSIQSTFIVGFHRAATESGAENTRTETQD